MYLLIYSFLYIYFYISPALPSFAERAAPTYIYPLRAALSGSASGNIPRYVLIVFDNLIDGVTQSFEALRVTARNAECEVRVHDL